MTTCKLGVVLVGVLAAVGIADGQPTAVDLGGPRQIKGQVAATADAYTVTATFRRVRVFDAATNDEINQELGREFAVRVLAKHLSPAADVQFEAARAEVRESKQDGERFIVTVRWPRDAVRVLTGSTTRASAARVVSPAAFTDKFFTAKQDHLDTLAAVVAANAAALRGAREQAAAAPAADQRRVLARGVARAEDRGLAALDALAADAKSDQNLLDLTDRPEILTATASARTRFVDDLRAALDDPLPAAKPTFRDVEIEKPFDKYLKANPLLMDLAGGVIVDDGERFLIGIGKTILKDGSAADLLRAERVCTLKARAAAIGERDGASISYLKRVEDRVVLVKDADGRESATSVSERLKITREQVDGIAKGLPVVGRWRSADGNIFFLAVGGKLPPPPARQGK